MGYVQLIFSAVALLLYVCTLILRRIMYTARVMLVWVLFILIIVLIDILHQLASIMNIVRYNYSICNYHPTKGVPFFVQRLL